MLAKDTSPSISQSKQNLHQYGDSQFTFERLSNDNFDEAAFLLSKIFSEREVIDIIVELPFEEQLSFVQTGKDSWISQNLSWVIKDQDNKVVGIMLNEDKNIVAIDSPPSPKVIKIYDVMQQAYNLVDNSQIIEENKGVIGAQFHLLMVAVDDKCKGMKLCEKLIEISIQDAAEKGFQEIFSECTSPGSAYVMEKKLGFKPISVLPYEALFKELNSSQEIRDFATMMFREEQPALKIQYLRLSPQEKKVIDSI
eukprot:403334828